MKRISTILILLMLVCMGTRADVTVTMVDGTNAPYDTYGTRNTGVSPQTFTSNAASGLADVVFSAPVIDRALWYNTYCLALEPSAVQTDEVFTITAPTGYVISGYNINFRANSSSCTYRITMPGGSATDVGISSTVNFSASSLYTKTLNIVVNAQGSSLNWLAVLSCEVTVKPIIVRPNNRVTSVSTGTNYMIFNAHNGRSGFVGGSGTSVTKPNHTKPASITDVGGTYLWQAEETETTGQYFLNHKGTGLYYIVNSLSATSPQAVKFTSFPNATNPSVTSSVNADGTINNSANNDTELWEIENNGKTGNNQFWNGNGTTFATWSDSHPYAVYTVTIPNAAYNLNDISTVKKYNIANPRGWWAVGQDATDVNSTTELGLAQAWNDTKQQFAFIEHDEKYYLYSVSQQKFAYVNGTKLSLSSEVTDAVLASPVTYTASASATTKGTYPFILTIGGKHFGVSTGHSPDVFQYTSTDDEGNGSLLIEAGDFDPTAVTAMFSNTVTLTYKVVYNNAVLAGVEAETESVVGQPLTIPLSLTRDGCTWNFYSDESCSTEVTTVDRNVTTIYAKCTFSLSDIISADDENLKWYRLAASSNSYYFDLYYNGSAPYPFKEQSAFDGSDGYFWAFTGNPIDGFTIHNKAAAGYTLYASEFGNGVAPIMDSENTSKWYMKISGDYIGFECAGTENAHRFLNDHGGGAASLKFYSGYTPLQYTHIDEVDYSNLYTNNIKPFIDNAGEGYFKISSTDATTLGSEYTAANSDEKITLSEYVALATSLNNKISWPTTGYYRVKSGSATTYLKAESASQLTVGGTGNEASSIVYLDGSTGTYTMQMQGQYVKAQANSYPVILQSGSINVYLTIPTVSSVVSPGKVAIGNGLTATDYLRVNDTNVVGLSMGSSISDQPTAYWTVEDANSFTITLNNAGDGNCYATTYLPFDVTITGANAYTLKRDGSNLEPKQLTDNKVPTGTAVLLQGTTTAATATINTGAAFTTDNTNSLSGTYLQKQFDLVSGATAEYFLGSNDAGTKVGFYHSGFEDPENSGKYTLSANRAYLSNGSEARGYAINWSDASSVQDMKAAEDVNSSVVYDLQGRRVENPQHGMYIRNGRVIVVK